MGQQALPLAWQPGAGSGVPRGARFCRCLEPVPEGVEELELVNGDELEGLAPGEELELAPAGGGQLLDEGWAPVRRALRLSRGAPAPPGPRSQAK